MALETSTIQSKLIEKFGEKTTNFYQNHDIFTIEVAGESIAEVISFLKEDEILNFNFLTDICGVHFPDNKEIEKQFSVVYHLHNWYENVRLRLKTYISSENLSIPTVSHIFLSANWMERETYDFYGINFKGHPQLKRILNMDEMISFPMRKEFPMEDSGRTDKDDRFFGRVANYKA